MEYPESYESQLRRILQKPETSPSRASPVVLEELKAAAAQRESDYQAVLEILEKSRGSSLGAEFQWMDEFLNTAGSSPHDLARLFVDEKYDAPWVLRPEYFKVFNTQFNVRKPSQSFSWFHYSSCGHQITNHHPSIVSTSELW